MTIGSGTINGTGTVTNNATMSLSAAKADGETISNNGTVKITNLEGDLTATFANINGTKEATWSGANATFAGTLNGAKVIVSNGNEMTISEGTLGSSIVDGDGSVNVAISADSSHDYSNLQLNNPANETIIFTGNSNFTGSFEDSKVQVDGGNTLTVNADIISNKIVANSGTVQVNNLDGAVDMDFTNISGGTVNANWSGDATFTGKLSTANLTVSSGTMTIGDTAIIATANNFVVNGTMVVDAEDISGKSSSGIGVMSVTNLNNDLDASFTNIATSTLNVEWINDQSWYTGNLDNVDKVTITSGRMQVTDTIIASKVIDGAGGIIVRDDDGTLADISNIANTGTFYLYLYSDIDLSENNQLGNVDSYYLNNQNITIKDSDITGRSAWGSGSNLTVKTDVASVGLNSINAEVNVILDFTSSITYTGDTTKVDTFIINGGNTLTIDASSVNVNTDTQTVTNNGTVTLTNLEGRADINLTKITGGTVNADWSGDGTFTGNLGSATVTVSSDTMTIDATKVTGKTITGAGTVLVDNLQAGTTADLSHITTTTLNAKWNSGDYLQQGSLTNVDNLEITAGEMSIDEGKLGTVHVSGGGGIKINTSDANTDVSHIDDSVDTTINITSAGSYSSSDFNADISGVDHVTLADGANTFTQTDDRLDGIDIKGGTGDDTFTFNDASLSSADIINAGTGTDTLSISDTASLTDVDFTNLSGFDTLTLSDNANSVILGSEAVGAGITSVTGGSASDNVTKSFDSAITVDGGVGTDTVNINETNATAITADTALGANTDFSNIEVLDFSDISLNVGADTSDGGTNAEFTITKEMIEAWTGSSDGDLTIKIKSDDEDKIEFVDKDGAKYGSDDTGAVGTTILDNTTYHLDADTDITIDIV
jgi:hypothetical protein